MANKYLEKIAEVNHNYNYNYDDYSQEQLERMGVLDYANSVLEDRGFRPSLSNLTSDYTLANKVNRLNHSVNERPNNSSAVGKGFLGGVASGAVTGLGTAAALSHFGHLNGPAAIVAPGVGILTAILAGKAIHKRDYTEDKKKEDDEHQKVQLAKLEEYLQTHFGN